MGKTVINLLSRDRIQNLEGYIFYKFFTTEKFWDGLPVSGNRGNVKYILHLR